MIPHRTVPFRTSPFSLVADEASSACWAGHRAVLTQLHKLCRVWANRSDSSLDVMWANLGAGKTHALFHLRHLLFTGFQTNPPAIVAYGEVPEHLKHFIELYRPLVTTLPIKEIAELGLKHGKGAMSASVGRACRALAFGNENEQRLARDWIIGARPGLRELKSVTGIDSRIETDVDAEGILTEIVHLAASGGRRAVILLDEFQRVGHLGQRTREALLSHIRALFSHNSSYFSMVLAVGSRMEKTAIEILSAELRTIMGMRPAISLPEMNKEEAEEFVLQRFAWYRPEGYTGAPEYPFTLEDIKYVIAYLVDSAKVRLIPRTLLQVFGIIYDELLGTKDAHLTNDHLKSVLDSLRWDDTRT